MCQKCNCIINHEQYRDHINKCWHKCRSCHQIFVNEEKFLEHFYKNENCKKDVVNKLNRKEIISLKNKFFSSENDFGKIKREKYENNLPKKDDKEEENDFILIDNKGYNIEYDLFFCGKNNGIDCKCCVNKTCSPEGELCPECMNKNKTFHELKNHYLINKRGKACKYNHGNFHCFSVIETIKEDEVGNFFKIQQKCSNKHTCEACKYITKLMSKYLSADTIKKLIKRDMHSN
jgi:hypothetical protein